MYHPLHLYPYSYLRRCLNVYGWTPHDSIGSDVEILCGVGGTKKVGIRG
jgi:head-tail adaptor